MIHIPDTPEADTDLSVLREMVRLAENKRSEALEAIERLNKYNLALIGFAGTFLSLLISTDIPATVLQVSGFCLIITIVVSLFAIRPQRIFGGSPDITEDILMLRQKKYLSLFQYLLDTADVTNEAGSALHRAATQKKRITIISALFLAFSLCTTYILIAYAKAS